VKQLPDFENPEGLPFIAVDEPTMSMTFGINNSPFYGRDGKFRYVKTLERPAFGKRWRRILP
jgi:predicted membrane GTPase involved in stress response